MSAIRTTLYYFSATGNSLHVARLLAEKLGDCSLVPITALRSQTSVVAAADRVGIVFPTHYFGLPPLVREFFSKISLHNASYAFAVTTSGSNRYLTSALHQAKALLAKTGQHLDAGYHVDMVSSYIPLSDIPPAAMVEQKLTAADRQTVEIADTVLAGRQIWEAEHFWVPFAAMNSLWRHKRLSQVYRKFTYADQCTACGICTRVCPVGNIQLANGRPQWQENCQECLACLHFCPARCIEFGTRTTGRKRYHHPRITLADMALR